MALSDITITVAAVNYVFKPAQVTSTREVVRLDTEHGSLALPMALMQATTPPSGNSPGRYMLKTGIARQNATTGKIVTVNSHTVLTVPQDPAITASDVILSYELLRTYMTTAVAGQMAAGILL